MLPRGLYPALVTPFTQDGSVDGAAVARLMAFQEASGSAGVVFAGTNGEGASLSAIEKRDMLRDALPAKGSLKVILGIATPSIHEAVWLGRQAAKIGADALLLSPPGFWKRADDAGLANWLSSVMDQVDCPAILYHNPPANSTGLPRTKLAELVQHPRCAGVKNSDVEAEDLAWWRETVPDDQVLWIGDERLLGRALDAGWTGAISGAGNIIPHWLAPIIAEWPSESARAKFDLITPILELMRASPQPETHKAALKGLGLLENDLPRLPLLPKPGGQMLDELNRVLGVR